MKTFIISAAFTVTAQTDDHLQDVQAIQDEITSWLDHLKADVTSVVVEEEQEATS